MNNNNDLIFYEKTLKQLRNDAKNFSQKYPSHASHLGMNNPEQFDPLIERLLEGVAYISGKIEEKIDSYEESILQSLLVSLYPSLFMPIPSKTIIEFNLPFHGPAKEILLPKETVIKIPYESQGKENTEFFTTLMPLWIKPLSISSSTLEEGNILKINFTVRKGSDLNGLYWDKMRIFFNSDKHANKKIFYALNSKVEAVSLCIESFHTSFYLGDSQCITFMVDNINDGFDTDSLVCKRNLMADYQNFFQRYQFFYLKCLKKILWPENVESFTVQIKFKTTMEHSLFEKNSLFTLNSVPAVNLFTDNSEPIIYDHNADFFPLRYDFENLNTIHTHSVKNVSAISLKDNQKTVLNKSESSSSEKKAHYLCKINMKNAFPVFELGIKGLSTQEKYILSVETTAYKNKDFSSLMMNESNSFYHEKTGKLQYRLLAKPTSVVLSSLKITSIQHYISMSSSKNISEEYLLKELKLFFCDNNPLIHHIRTLQLRNSYVLDHGIAKSCTIFQVLMSIEDYLPEELFIFGYMLHEYFLESEGFENIVKTELILEGKGMFYQWDAVRRKE